MKLSKKIVNVEKINPIDYVIYIDTDSVFLSAIPIVKVRKPNLDVSTLETNQEMVNSILEIASEMQNYVNSSYNIMAKKMFNVKNHTFEIKQEIISTTGFWLAKKRYAQWRINENGKHITEDSKKLEVKGIDIIRTSFPIKFRKFLEEILKMVLFKNTKEEIDKKILEFQINLKNCTVLDVAKNTSVKFISRDKKKDYNPKSRHPFSIITGTPAQAKAALYYIDLLRKFNLQKNVEIIYSGSKIKWVYMLENPYNIDCLAFKADGTDPKEIMDIIEKYIDKKGLYDHELKSKLEDFYKVLGWQFPNSNDVNASRFFDF